MTSNNEILSALRHLTGKIEALERKLEQIEERQWLQYYELIRVRGSLDEDPTTARQAVEVGDTPRSPGR